MQHDNDDLGEGEVVGTATQQLEQLELKKNVETLEKVRCGFNKLLCGDTHSSYLH